MAPVVNDSITPFSGSSKITEVNTPRVSDNQAPGAVEKSKIKSLEEFQSQQQMDGEYNLITVSAMEIIPSQQSRMLDDDLATRQFTHFV
jgi:hypothetical protein